MFINYEKVALEKIRELKSKNLFRKYPIIDLLPNNPPYALVKDKNGKSKKVVIWGNNNYLCLNSNPKLIEAKNKAVEKFGTGSGGTRNILGNSSACENLEREIANWYDKERGLIYTSALDANIGTISALGKQLPDCLFLSDEKNHASIIDGIKLSKASKLIFKHMILKSLEDKLIKARGLSDKKALVIIVESIYSMDGDFAPLKQIIKLKEKYNALLYLDEVHAVGLYGKKGSGYAEHLALLKYIDIICGTFGKAMGVQGGYICGSRNIIELIRHYSRNFIFTTSLAPDTCEACREAISIVSSAEGKILREKLCRNLSLLKKYLLKEGIEFIDNQSHILPIIIGNEKRTIKIAEHLLKTHNIAVTPIFSPTVQIGTARLRINITPYHNEKMIKEFCDALKDSLKKYKDSEFLEIYANGQVIARENFITKDNYKI